MSPKIISKQRQIEKTVISLLLMILSKKTMKTGEVKLTMMRSPIDMRGIAAKHAKLAVEIVKA